MTQTVMLISVQYASIWGTPFVEIYDTRGLQVVIQLRFSTESEKLSHWKKSLKKSNCLSLTECLGKNKSLSNIVTQILKDVRYLHKLLFMVEILLKIMLMEV